MNKMPVRNYNGCFSKLIREVHKNAGIYLQNPINKNKMFSFCVEEQKGLAYHLEGLRVPLVVPQFGNHCSNWMLLYAMFLQLKG